MITALSVLGGVGLVMGGLLALGRTFFAVKTDPRFEHLMDILPGANCGGCGYPGCSGYANALLSGEAGPTACPPGGPDIATEIGHILGIEITATHPMVALVACAGGNDASPFVSEYRGIRDCQAAHQVAGGSKACRYGCLGLGTCAAVCQFGAIEVTGNGLVRIIPEKCTGCRACVTACPRQVIKMVPKKETVHVLCNNPDKAKAVKAVCSVGCTGCKLCTRESDRITMDGFLAKVQGDPDTPIPASAALSCPQCAIFDRRAYSLQAWLINENTRDAHKQKASAWKAEQKQNKARKRERASDKTPRDRAVDEKKGEA